jgi:ubiquitin related modifier 1
VHKVEITTSKDGQGKVTTPKEGQDKVTMKSLLSWVKDNLIKERPEMFVKGDSVYVLFFLLPPLSLHLLD